MANDANGNMTARNTGNPVTSFVFSYDSENRLSMATSSNTTLRFVYDGDGSRVETIQTVISTTTTTIMIGGYYEWVSSSDWKKYYFAGSERIAFMKYSNLMYYLFSDHLGSTVVTRYQLGNVYRNGYYPFLLQPKASECFAGEDRYTSSYTPYQFTDQRKEAVIGLYDYNARFYDPSIGRFTSADTIVPGPGSPQSWDSYAYVNNNPINNTDPTGHWVFEYSPNDPNYVPAHSGINPFRRYVTAGVTQSEADKIFKSQIKSPTNSPDPMPHGFGDDRGVREFPDQWFSKRQFHASMDAEHEVGLILTRLLQALFFLQGGRIWEIPSLLNMIFLAVNFIQFMVTLVRIEVTTPTNMLIMEFALKLEIRLVTLQKLELPVIPNRDVKTATPTFTLKFVMPQILILPTLLIH